MKVTKTPFQGLLIIEPTVYTDERGHFYESYNQETFLDAGINNVFVQDNQSYSKRNVIRGLHFQSKPYDQTKLIRVLQGKILDIAVDLRKDQPTYKQIFSFELSSENKLQLLIPSGFAHGFSVIGDGAEILYKCDQHYHPEHAAGIVYNDPELNIDWRIKPSEAIISAKDAQLPPMSLLAIDL